MIDVKSDTVTTPTKAMREAMMNAEVGDDVYGEDPTVNKLQRVVASLFGKEAGLFVPTGTMGNLVSIMAHCNERGCEILLGDQSHINLFEQGGLAQIAGVHPQQIRNNPDGTLDMEELESKIRKEVDDHFPTTKLICIENTHNVLGGRVLPPSYMKQVADLARKYNLKVHLDGARILNAAAALKVAPIELTKYVDSVSMCLSKGLGAPVGSVVTGTDTFISLARRMRKALGGGMRQAGILAAAGLYALEHIQPLIHLDHKRAEKIATSLSTLRFIGVELKPVESNMVYFTTSHPELDAPKLAGKLEEVREIGGKQVSVKVLVEGERLLRIVLHHLICDEDCDCVVEKLKLALED